MRIPGEVKMNCCFGDSILGSEGILVCCFLNKRGKKEKKKKTEQRSSFGLVETYQLMNGGQTHTHTHIFLILKESFKNIRESLELRRGGSLINWLMYFQFRFIGFSISKNLERISEGSLFWNIALEENQNQSETNTYLFVRLGLIH